MNKRYILIIAVSFLLFVIVFTGTFLFFTQDKRSIPNDIQVTNTTESEENSEIFKKYDEAILFIEKGDYISACTSLAPFSDGTYNNDNSLIKDAQKIFFYAQAQALKESDLPKSLGFIDKIPIDYIGKYSGEIKVLRELLQTKNQLQLAQNDEKLQEKKTAESQQNLKEQLVYIESDLKQNIINCNAKIEQIDLLREQNAIGIDDSFITECKLEIQKQQYIIDAMDKAINIAENTLFKNDSEKRIKIHELTERKNNAINGRAYHTRSLNEIRALSAQWRKELK